MYSAQQAAVSRSLQARGITAFSEEWLSACLAYLEECCAGLRLSAAELQEQVTRQWLDTDLATIGASVLPADVISAPVASLRGAVALQLVSCVDVGQPAHGQLLRLRRLHSANTEVSSEPAAAGWEPKPTRALRLTLTDGVQTVVALEYRPVAALRSDLAPGVKVLLKGVLECRRGVLLLTPDAVQLLGGSVDDLQVPQHEQRALEERIGAAAAGIPAGPLHNAVHVPTAAGQIPRDQNTAEGYSAERRGDSGRGWPPGNVDDGFADDVDDAELAAIGFDDDIDDAELAALDMDAVDEPASPVAPPPVKRRRQELRQPGVRAGGASVQLGSRAGATRVAVKREKTSAPARQQKLDVYMRPSQPERPPVPPAAASSRCDPSPPSRLSGPPDRAGCTAGSGAAPALRPPPAFDPCPWSDLADELLSPAAAAAPFGYFSQLRPGGSVTAKAFIMTQVSKLSTAGGRWSLGVLLNDGCRSLEAVLSDSVLRQLIKLSVDDVTALRADPGSRGRLRAALDSAQTAIIKLNCLMCVEAPADGGLPQVTRVSEVTEQTLRALSASMAVT